MPQVYYGDELQFWVPETATWQDIEERIEIEKKRLALKKRKDLYFHDHGPWDNLNRICLSCSKTEKEIHAERMLCGPV